MKLSEIENSDPVLVLVDKAREELGEDALYGGNCGMFAVAVAKKLREQSILVTLGVLYRDDDSIQTPGDITVNEADVYHIVVEYNGNYYDGTGKVTADTLLDIANDQYGDNQPGFFTEVDPFSQSVLRMIRSDTNWNTDSSEFYEVFSEESSIEKVDEIELAPDIKKRDLGKADDLDYVFITAKRENLIVSQKPLYSDKKYKIVLAKGYFSRGTISAIVIDSSNKNQVAAVVDLSKYSRYGYQVEETKVRPAYQGQALGLKTYKALVKDFDITLVSGGVQSLGGAKLWAALYKSPGITVFGYNPRNRENKFFHVEIDDSGKVDSLYGRDVYGDSDSLTDHEYIRLIAVADKNL